jgi:hypothetical protein
MEPTVAALAVVASAEAERRAQGVPPWSERARAICAAALFAQALWNGVAAVRSAREEVPLAIAKRDALASVARQCVASPRDVVFADEPGLELELDGRLLGTPFQMGHLFAAGRLPREPWLRDLERPEVRCVVAQRAELEGELWPPEARRFDLFVRDAIRRRFALDAALSHGGLWVYRRRDPSATAEP